MEICDSLHSSEDLNFNIWEQEAHDELGRSSKICLPQSQVQPFQISLPNNMEFHLLNIIRDQNQNYTRK